MKTCIITLDLINDICHQDGQLARYADRIAQSDIINRSNRVLAWGRGQGHLIAHVRLGFREHYQDASHISPLFSKMEKNKLLKSTDWGSSFCEELQRADSDIDIIKHRVSAFYGTDLELILRAHRVEKLILCGVATNNAVELTAREAHDRDYYVTVVGDATATASDAEQEMSLRFLAKIATVVAADALIK